MIEGHEGALPQKSLEHLADRWEVGIQYILDFSEFLRASVVNPPPTDA